MAKTGSRKKTVVEYEAEARRVGKCLIHTSGVARKVYMLRHGKLPSHICVCHTCDHSHCILDEHHFPGTQGDNMKDAQQKGRLNHKPATKVKLSVLTKKQFESDTARQQHSEIMIEYYKSHPEVLVQMSKSAKKRLESPEARLELGARVRKSHARPEVKKRLSAGGKRRFSRKEEREGVSRRGKALWADDTYRKTQTEAIAAGHQTPEFRADTSKRQTKLWSVSKHRKKMLNLIRSPERRAHLSMMATKQHQRAWLKKTMNDDFKHTSPYEYPI